MLTLNGRKWQNLPGKYFTQRNFDRRKRHFSKAFSVSVARFFMLSPL
jgi:hypothetical protein